jgi:serine/threonine-protein kinase RsbW
VQQCKQLGFFFAGVLPFGLHNRHELILQYMNNLEINYDMIKPYSERAAGILEYVRLSDPNRAN